MIALAVQKGSFVEVYNEKNNKILTLNLTISSGDAFVGFTSNTITIKRGCGNRYYIYDENGKVIMNRPI